MNHLLSPERDPMGAAIYEYYTKGKASKLRVRSSMFEEDEIPVATLFRKWEEMSALEQTALNECRGRILDVGAGSGCHSLVLKGMQKDVMGIDISSYSVTVMKEQGLKAEQRNLFDSQFTDQFDTILMLMNGSGIIGKVENMDRFFARVKELLRPGGQILMDSSDLRYLYEDEDGSFLIDLNADYYGEVDYKMVYKRMQGDRFDWLYVDFDTLRFYANKNGFHAEKIFEGEHYDYLARLHKL